MHNSPHVAYFGSQSALLEAIEDLLRAYLSGQILQPLIMPQRHKAVMCGWQPSVTSMLAAWSPHSGR